MQNTKDLLEDLIFVKVYSSQNVAECIKDENIRRNISLEDLLYYFEQNKQYAGFLQKIIMGNLKK